MSVPHEPLRDALSVLLSLWCIVRTILRTLMHGLSPPLNLSDLVEEKQKLKMKDEGMNILLTHNKLP